MTNPHPYETPEAAWNAFVIWVKSNGKLIKQDPKSQRITSSQLHAQWQAWRVAWIWNDSKGVPVSTPGSKTQEPSHGLNQPTIASPWDLTPDDRVEESREDYERQFKKWSLSEQGPL